MACWRCECGFKNCDTGTCQNPKCTEKPEFLLPCIVCGKPADGDLLHKYDQNKKLPMCTSCVPTHFKFYAEEFSFQGRYTYA